MSFVGTRPEATKYVEKYSNEMLATLLLRQTISFDVFNNNYEKWISAFEKKTGRKCKLLFRLVDVIKEKGFAL